MLRPNLHPTREKRSVVDRQVHGETDGRRGKYPQEQPALPVAERAGRPENEDDQKERPEHSLNNRLPMERIHIKTPGRYRRSPEGDLSRVLRRRRGLTPNVLPAAPLSISIPSNLAFV